METTLRDCFKSKFKMPKRGGGTIIDQMRINSIKEKKGMSQRKKQVMKAKRRARKVRKSKMKKEKKRISKLMERSLNKTRLVMMKILNHKFHSLMVRRIFTKEISINKNNQSIT